MMQAWKYSLPAFLVPFFFSVTAEGANLLIVNASLVGFILATLTAVLSLFILAAGIVGIFYGKLNVAERAALILSALALVLFPIGITSLGWVVAFLIAWGVLTRNYLLYRKRNAIAI